MEIKMDLVKAIKNKAGVSGLVLVELFKDGKLDSQEVCNLVVQPGLNYLAALLQSGSGNVMNYMAVGSGADTVDPSDTTLSPEGTGTNEIDRIVLTDRTVSANAVTFKTTFGSGVATGTIQEAGLFDSASVGVMLARTVFGAKVKGPGDILVITWVVSLN